MLGSLVSYPLTVRLNSHDKTFRDPDELLANYSSVLTPQVIAAILNQDFRNLFVNYQGVRVGRGELWFGGVYEEGQSDYTVKIIAINTKMD